MSVTYSKVHKSALCLIPPLHAWPQIQAIRSKHDKSFVRWPPHINILYPFWQDQGEAFLEAATQATHALEHVRPFQITFQSLSNFRHGKSCTIWLDPSSEELLELQSRLQGVFPDCSDLTSDPSRNITKFVPHLSLGQWSHATVERATQDLSKKWAPMTFTVSEVALISREGFTDPFTVRYTIPLGTATDEASYTQPKEAGLQYDAASGCFTPKTHAARTTSAGPNQDDPT